MITTKGELLVLLATFFASATQVLFKLGTNSTFQVLSFPINANIVIGFGLYAIAALILFRALRSGKLSTLYPIWSLSFVWVFIASAVIFSEAVTIANLIGIILIVAGVSLVGKFND